MLEVIMPKMGDAMEEGVLLEWLKKEGESVNVGEPIATIQTDKATLELEAEASGTLAGLLIPPGETVPVGKAMALILGSGESKPASWGSGAPAARTASPTQQAAASSSSRTAPPSAEIEKAAAALLGGTIAPEAMALAPADAGRIKASPLAKKVALDLGVDLATVPGTGPGGRIVEADVRSVAPVAARSEASVEPAVSVTPAAPAIERGDVLVPLNRIRQITAERTVLAKQQAPHFYVTVEVDVEKLLGLKEQFELEGAGKLSINDFVLKACAMALIEMPVVNSSFQGEKILQHGSVNIGMAVALEDGLTLPVIHRVDAMSIRQIAERSRELAQMARENRLQPDELSGSTFSISNMGMLNVDNFAAILNVPNAAIVAVSTARRVVVPVEDQEEADKGPIAPGWNVRSTHDAGIEVRRRMNVTGSFDHRVVDGSVGAKFMNLLRDHLQNPTRLLG
jgi:pyruvate dehydrogenase E2 component (dihydrolipoamide acetyltransferase)